MLSQIANFCPVIARKSIIKGSTSIKQIWQSIRLHYGFQSTGAHVFDFADIKQEPDERPEDLFQRILAFIITEDEEISLTVENLMVLIWLSADPQGPPMPCQTTVWNRIEIS